MPGPLILPQQRGLGVGLPDWGGWKKKIPDWAQGIADSIPLNPATSAIYLRPKRGTKYTGKEYLPNPTSSSKTPIKSLGSSVKRNTGRKK